MTQTPLFIGIDGGGTKCKATLFSPDLIPISVGVAGPANVSRELDQAQRSIVESTELALNHAGIDPLDSVPKLKVFAGLAGANIASSNCALSQWRHPFQDFSFTSDLCSAATGAHAGNNGAVLIVGTGSCAASLVNGEITQFGGYGFLLGDKGSGAWLGRSLVQRSLECADGVLAESDLTRQLFDAHKCSSAEALVDVFNQQPPAFFASLAPLVIDAAHQNDAIATMILHEAADYLNDIADKALQLSGGQLALVGGVANAIKPWLSNAIQTQCISPMKSPEWGALYYFQHIDRHAK